MYYGVPEGQPDNGVEFLPVIQVPGKCEQWYSPGHLVVENFLSSQRALSPSAFLCGISLLFSSFFFFGEAVPLDPSCHSGGTTLNIGVHSMCSLKGMNSVFSYAAMWFIWFANQMLPISSCASQIQFGLLVYFHPPIFSLSRMHFGLIFSWCPGDILIG